METLSRMAAGLLLVTAQLSRAINVFCGNQLRLWAVFREMGEGKNNLGRLDLQP